MTKRIGTYCFSIFFAAVLVMGQGNADVVNSAAVNSIAQLTQIELYPNPAVDYLMVEVNESDFTNVQFELRSMIGNRIQIEAEEIEPNKYRIQLEDFASGYYFLIVRDDFLRFKKAYKFLKN